MFKNRTQPQMTILRTRVVCSIPKATNTHSEYVMRIDFPTTRMGSGMRLAVTFYVNCLTCSLHEICDDVGTGPKKM